MDFLPHDLRYGVRCLLNTPAFTATAVLTLALGIGANTAMFTVANTLLLRPAPFEHADRLYWVYATNEKQHLTVTDQVPPSSGDFLDLRRATRLFDHMVAWRNWWFSVSGPHESAVDAEQVRGVNISPGFFDMLGVHTELGRTFRADEEQPGQDHVVLLTDGFWRRRFGGDPRIVDQKIVIDGQPFTVVGVLPSTFYFLFADSAIFMPLPVDATFRSGRAAHNIEILARAAPGVDRGRAQADMGRVAHDLAVTYPGTNEDWNAALQPVFPLNKNLRPAVLVLLSAVGCVLFIACVNVAGLLLVRAGVREREFAIRTALGASSWRLFRQLLTESVLLATTGGITGVMAAAGGLRLLVPLLPQVQIVGPPSMTIDGRVLLFTSAVTLMTAIALGMAPAFQTRQTHALRVSSQAPGHSRTGATLLAVQIALSLMLLIGAALLVRSLWNLEQVDPGFRADHLLTMQLWLSPTKYNSSSRVTRFYQEVLRRLHELPEVREAAVVNTRPFLGWRLGARLHVPGRALDATGEEPIVGLRVVSPGYLTALRAPLLRGRPLAESDGPTNAPVALINETMARRFWPNENPLGKSFSTRPLGSVSDAPWWPVQVSDTFTIVGIVGDVKESRLNDRAEPVVYWSYLQNATRYAHLLVRTGSTPTNITTLVQQQIHAVDPDLGVYDAQSMESVLDQAVAAPRLNSVLLWVFAAIGLVLSAVGIYGVTAYAVSRRTRELAIRIALGAPQASVFRLMTRHGTIVALVGIVAGMLGALGLARSLSSLLYGVTATDATTLACSAASVLVVTLLACARPAWRATRVDPIVALRAE
ncbi:MAG: ABC transporter permease [Vicinamibacterales bacterium]